jgi:hypothetical protein
VICNIILLLVELRIYFKIYIDFLEIRLYNLKVAKF